MLHVSVRALPAEVPAENLATKAVAVIDVLRATSVMATALHHGAKGIFPVAEIDQARRLRQDCDDNALLCGERNGRRIEGFDLGNSPFEFDRQTVEGKSLIMCTTNGTRAIAAASEAKVVLALSFVNMSAAATTLLQTGLDIELLCAGTNGRFSMDDALCAGMTLGLLSKLTNLKTNDLGEVLLKFARQRGSIAGKLRHCTHKVFLEASGYARDLAYCLTTDCVETVPIRNPQGWFVAAGNL
ncbi:MAG: 2-phosphosulfolactate phosphatase [Bacteroidetes bacterium]|nr:2-phosphosulfolactate phosphatase [Bacteroidota bacterium]